ncbi:hypothetical protein CA606_07025 [Caulobacter vibrioides]|uniref:Uncharacterized protein n=1 Tax=Caulobacter vibrioides TaxID=155892 RepID=A0A290MJZ9_CAUVI|nr:glycoside hydrolase family 75 protein [Caulobacter vibrioides]ATC32123.1 hypothetical protein CA606_07025 [Caulobacter vibrioides]
MRLNLVASLGAAGVLLVGEPAASASIGACKFDSVRLRFAGTAQEQAACLLKRILPRGAGSVDQPVPVWLSVRLDTPVGISAEALTHYLSASGVAPDAVGGAIVAGEASDKRYFVIHDTSSPVIEDRDAFPADMDLATYKGNTLSWPGLAKRANLIITRDGRSGTFNRWSAARDLPATKLEQNSVLPAARKVFVHVENVQPRIQPKGSWAWKAPVPGLTIVQRRRLALAYVAASVSVGRWLIPALHFNVDKGGPAGEAHDDAQNFDLAAWVEDVQAIDAAVRAGKPAPPIEKIASANLTAPTWPSWVNLSSLTDVDENYRGEFMGCDTANRFRSISLPATLSGRTYYGCISDPNQVTALRQAAGVPGKSPKLVAFTSKLSVDLDGSWYACHTPGQTDQCGTSLSLRNSAGVETPVSSDFVPYVVMPVAGPTSALAQEFRSLTGLKMGDFGVVLTKTDVIPVILADGGPFPKLGEGSIALHRHLGRELCKTKDAQGRCTSIVRPLSSAAGPFVTVLFPGSRIPGLKAEEVEAVTKREGLRLWEQVRAGFDR